MDAPVDAPTSRPIREAQVDSVGFNNNSRGGGGGEIKIEGRDRRGTRGEGVPGKFDQNQYMHV